MKVSVNWMQRLAGDVRMLPPGGIGELVEKIGVQLGAVEEVVNLGERYQGIVVAKVMTCEKHPDADKLQLCKIDDGGVVQDVERDSDGLVQVVCGAPNVRAGLLAAWLPPGVTVPASLGKQPLTLEARAIRGQVSHGMLASAHELGLSDDHSGILEIDEAATPGTPLAEVYSLDDYIIDIENKMFTHRPDCFGQLGVAREIAGITGQTFKSPEIYLGQPAINNDDSGLRLNIDNQLPELVPRFMVQLFKDVQVKPSPLWLQTYLTRLGQKPINNIVDITNYFMLQTGQPLHAYDYDKVKALSDGDAKLVVRFPQTGEKIKLLNGKEIEPRPEAIMIATDQQLIGIGGVMGGSDAEVDANTSNIILECANFDMYSVRRTSMEHGLFTDAVTRFSKGQSPRQCDRVLAWAQADIVELSGAQPGNVYDVSGDLPLPATVEVTTEFINDRLGSSLTAEDMAKLLTNVEFHVEVEDDRLSIQAPFWRTDIGIAEDIVEEVGRLYGYQRLPAELPHRAIKPAARNQSLELQSRIRQILSSAGANELLTYSFVHADLLRSAGQSPADAYRLTNALSPDLQHYRISLIPSLLERVHPNLKAGIDQLAVFEMNPAHNKRHDKAQGHQLPAEIRMLSLVYAAQELADYPAGAAYFQARHYLEFLLRRLGIEPRFEIMAKDTAYPVTQPFEPARSALVYDAASGHFIGMAGEFRPAVRQALKLPQMTAGFELSLDSLLQLARPHPAYRPIPRFPAIRQDITLRLPAATPFAEIHDFASNYLDLHKPESSQLTLTPVDIYRKAEDPDHQQVTLRLEIAAFDRTLTNQQINQLLDDMAAAASQLQAQRV